jgi:hypothetical protein
VWAVLVPPPISLKENNMPDKTMSNLKVIGILLALALAIVSPIIAVDRANNSNAFIAEAATKTAQAAADKAESAKDLAEKNARDFEYFKGEMTATMKAHKDGLDKMDKKMDKHEVKLDELIKIMSGFMRAGDAKR